jgi:hypothetical protein
MHDLLTGGAPLAKPSPSLQAVAAK